MIPAPAPALRHISSCRACGAEITIDQPECEAHPDTPIVQAEVFTIDAGRDRACEMAQWCARQALACDAPAEVRAAARMVLDDAPDVATAQVVIGWYQEERREGML